MFRAYLLAALLSLGVTVSNSFARFAYALVLPAMRGELGWNYVQSGWLNTANAIGYLIGAILTRRNAIGRKPARLRAIRFGLHCLYDVCDRMDARWRRGNGCADRAGATRCDV